MVRARKSKVMVLVESPDAPPILARVKGIDYPGDEKREPCGCLGEYDIREDTHNSFPRIELLDSFELEAE